MHLCGQSSVMPLPLLAAHLLSLPPSPPPPAATPFADLADLLVSPPARTLSIIQFASRSSRSIPRSPVGSTGSTMHGPRTSRTASGGGALNGGDGAMQGPRHLRTASVGGCGVVGGGGSRGGGSGEGGSDGAPEARVSPAAAVSCEDLAGDKSTDDLAAMIGIPPAMHMGRPGRQGSTVMPGDGRYGVRKMASDMLGTQEAGQAEVGGEAGLAQLPSLPQLLLRRGMGGSARSEGEDLVRSASRCERVWDLVQEQAGGTGCACGLANLTAHTAGRGKRGKSAGNPVFNKAGCCA